MAREHHDHAHQEAANPVTSLSFIVAELSDTEALVRYDCPCGCKPATEYVKDAVESEYESCCCGNVHFVGPNARADLDAYLTQTGEAAGYTVKEAAVAAPWGGTIPVAYGLPHESREH